MLNNNQPGRIFHSLANILQAFFSPDDEKEHSWLPLVWISLIFLAGGILWGVFFNWGSFSINFMDWAEVWAPRMQAWRDALLKNTLPFHLSDIAAMRTESDRYFSVADMVSSPQVILLRWLDVGTYTLVNNFLLYGIASYFLLRIRKRYHLSLFAFTVLFLLFHFNGFIVTHLSVGHLSWGGYYLFPAFVLYLMEMLAGDRSWNWVARMSFLLCFMFMQGSFHHMVWCFIVLGIIAIIRWRHFFQIVKAGIFTILLSMPRIIPAFIQKTASISQEIDSLGGYPFLKNIRQAMTYPATPILALPGRIFDSKLGFWEFDIYTGWVGFAFIFVFGGLLMLFWSYRKREFPFLIVPVLVLMILSIGNNFLKVLFYNAVLSASERVTSRMMGLALVILIILAVIYYQKTMDHFRQHGLVLLAQITLLVILAKDLVSHTLHWSVKNAAQSFEVIPRDLPGVHISNHIDPEYFTMLAIGLGISIFSALFLIWMTRKTTHTVENQNL